MPIAHSNNAVAAIDDGTGARIYSFLGLMTGKTHADVSRQAFEYDVADDRWRRLPDMPVSSGRLAAVAAAVDGKLFVFGGYTVAADGGEVSTADVYAFDPLTDRYDRRADMPVPVDDSLVAVHGRLIYLVSGWHNDSNVTAVQVYDTVNDRWFRATDFPGTPVFGHAGGIADGHIIVIDGVAVLGRTAEGRNRYGLMAQAWQGTIDSADPAKIIWQTIAHHGTAPLYRAAGGGQGSMVLFAGGSTRAYNYNGIGYDGVAAEPSAQVFGYDTAKQRWCAFGPKAVPSMDHRSLAVADGHVWTIGGMTAGQTVSNRTERFQPVARSSACAK